MGFQTCTAFTNIQETVKSKFGFNFEFYLIVISHLTSLPELAKYLKVKSFESNSCTEETVKFVNHHGR